MSKKKLKKKNTTHKKKSNPVTNKNDLKSSINLCEKYLITEKQSLILETLIPFKDNLNSNDENLQSRYNRLLAFGYAFNNKLMEAEESCREGLSKDISSYDYYFILSYIHLALREFKKVNECAKKYLNLKSKSQNIYKQYTESDNYESQLHNFYGSALMESKDFEKASVQFQLSVEKDEGNHLPYINWVNNCLFQNDNDRAVEILNKGLKKSRQVHELRLLEDIVKNKQTISACMIVKDEEELLPGCLESIRSWVDEIIVVDTGSTDETVSIAKSFGARVFHQKWEGNFSKHRNYSLEQASCDWVFIIDADERIVEEDIPLIKQSILNKENNILSINVYNLYGSHRDITTFLPSVRFWRNDIKLRYEGIVHNLLKLGEEHPVTRTTIKLNHLGYDLSRDKMDQKFKRTKDLLEKQLNDNPDDFFALFNYAQLLKSEGEDYPVENIPDIIKAASRAVEITDPSKKEEKHIHLMCLDQIAWAHFYNHEYEKAYEFTQRALKIKPNYLDPLMLVAHIYAHEKKWEEAKDAYNNYLDVVAEYNPSLETDPLIITNIDNKAAAFYSLALIAETYQQFDKAKEYYMRILSTQKGYLEANNRLAKLYQKENNLNEAKDYFLKQLEFSYKTSDTFIGLAEINARENNLEEAEKYYQMALQEDAFNTLHKIKYSEFLISVERVDEGLGQIKEIMDKKPDSININQMVGDIYYRLECFEDAIRAYENVIRINPEIPETLNNLANCYFKNKQFEKAENYYLKALKLENPDSMLYRNLGLAQVGLQKIENAIVSLETYLGKNDDFPILSILGDLYLNLSEYQKALENYERYLSQNPQDFGVIFSLSECYLLMGHKDSAKVGYQRVVGIEPNFKPALERLNELSESISQH